MHSLQYGQNGKDFHHDVLWNGLKVNQEVDKEVDIIDHLCGITAVVHKQYVLEIDLNLV